MTDTSVASPATPTRRSLRRIHAGAYSARVVLAEDGSGGYRARSVYVYRCTTDHVGAPMSAEIAAALRQGLAVVDDRMDVVLTHTGVGRAQIGREA